MSHYLEPSKNTATRSRSAARRRSTALRHQHFSRGCCFNRGIIEAGKPRARSENKELSANPAAWTRIRFGFGLSWANPSISCSPNPYSAAGPPFGCHRPRPRCIPHLCCCFEALSTRAPRSEVIIELESVRMDRVARRQKIRSSEFPFIDRKQKAPDVQALGRSGGEPANPSVRRPP
jgi:hypothetical protein